MTYSVGGLIQAVDYNGFVSTTTAANVNATWSTGVASAGWGQTALNTVSAGGTVTAAQWASLVNTLSAMGSQTGTTITSRTAPVAGNVISVLANVNTDLSNCYTNRGNAAGSGTAYGIFTGTTSKTSATSNGTQGAWTITFTHTITFPSADQARYFFNAGGIVKLQFGKSVNSTDIDGDWNTLAGWVGSINITGGAQTIASQAYTGTTRLGGSGGTQTTLSTGTGWFALSGSAQTIFQLNNTGGAYTGQFIRVQAASSATTMTLTTVWSQPSTSTPGATTNISGGTATSSPSTTITGTAPTTLCTYIPPSTSFLTNTWGTPTIAASVA
jgi:hypothetical protein